MYSKSMGTAYFGERRSGIHAPAAGLREPAAGLREPAYRQTVRVPPNYSGHAFRDGEERSPEQIMNGDSRRDRPPNGEEPPTPRFDNLPRVSTLGHRENARPALPMAEERPHGDLPRGDLPRGDLPPAEEPIPAVHTGGNEGCPCGQTCLPAVPPCRRDDTCGRDDKGQDRGILQGIMERFPFGHGFGFEELLLIGLMLLLLHEGDGEGDLGETLVLLGVLLLCG
jgi:hypothetical protein